MTAEGQTCVYPKKGHDMVLPRSWQKPNTKQDTWFSQLNGGFEVKNIRCIRVLGFFVTEISDFGRKIC